MVALLEIQVFKLELELGQLWGMSSPSLVELDPTRSGMLSWEVASVTMLAGDSCWSPSSGIITSLIRVSFSEIRLEHSPQSPWGLVAFKHFTQGVGTKLSTYDQALVLCPLLPMSFNLSPDSALLGDAGGLSEDSVLFFWEVLSISSVCRCFLLYLS